ncbi:MAG: nitrite reductase (NADH) large subunit [Gammaproteobacteria bacterium]|jgi:nitrite reductase (NADH) large subunit
MGRLIAYESLILATGSRARIPNIPGIGRSGVFTFRDLDDAEKLAARRLRSRHTIVLGGGLLGLETARAMRRFNTNVTIVEHSSHIMFNQLNDGAARRLAAIIGSQNISVRTDTTVFEVKGGLSVESLLLGDGTELPCDTSIVAAGIVPNIDLARAADL